MRRKTFIFGVAALAALAVVRADEPVATSAVLTFDVNLAAASPYAIADFDGMPVTWRKGESVRSVSPNGVVSAYVTDASAAGSGALGTLSGGVCTLENDGIASVKVAVPWSINSDGASFAINSSPSSPFAIDTELEGPNRKRLKNDPVVPVAYSGDDWSGDLSKAATLTFTPPAGSGLAETTLTPGAGDGATSFTFAEPGEWTVLLIFADATTRTAIINVRKGGLIISFH